MVYTSVEEKVITPRKHPGSTQKTCEIPSYSFPMDYELGGAGAVVFVSPEVP